jgi:hypothetical protein
MSDKGQSTSDQHLLDKMDMHPSGIEWDSEKTAQVGPEVRMVQEAKERAKKTTKTTDSGVTGY